MRPGQNGELIFEGTTEARVASELISDMNGTNFSSRLGLEQQLEEPRIGRADFLARRIEDACGTSDDTEYTISDPDKAWIAVRALQIASLPDNILFPVVPGILRRDIYMQKRLNDYIVKASQTILE